MILFSLHAELGLTLTPSSFVVGDMGIKQLSRGTAVILLVVYGCYLYFQLGTHAEMYNEPSRKAESKRSKPDGASRASVANIGRCLASGISSVPPLSPSEEKEKPELQLWTAIGTLATSTTLVALCAEYMVESIDVLTQKSGISKTFVSHFLR